MFVTHAFISYMNKATVGKLRRAKNKFSTQLVMHRVTQVSVNMKHSTSSTYPHTKANSVITPAVNIDVMDGVM
jgi:hypothetical protein